jgi:hypothetical protein
MVAERIITEGDIPTRPALPGKDLHVGAGDQALDASVDAARLFVTYRRAT